MTPAGTQRQAPARAEPRTATQRPPGASAGNADAAKPQQKTNTAEPPPAATRADRNDPVDWGDARKNTAAEAPATHAEDRADSRLTSGNEQAPPASHTTAAPADRARATAATAEPRHAPRLSDANAANTDTRDARPDPSNADKANSSAPTAHPTENATASRTPATRATTRETNGRHSAGNPRDPPNATDRTAHLQEEAPQHSTVLRAALQAFMQHGKNSRLSNRIEWDKISGRPQKGKKNAGERDDVRGNAAAGCIGYDGRGRAIVPDGHAVEVPMAAAVFADGVVDGNCPAFFLPFRGGTQFCIFGAV